VEVGLADENLALELAPGASLDLPTILIQGLPDGRVESGSVPVHRWAQNNLLANHWVEPPIVYNTWLEFFDLVKTKPESLRAQMRAAKECGCEVFVVDAGWFGSGGPDGLAEVGDWLECGRACFPGGLTAFSEEVRSAGLGFGLWMEPERARPPTPGSKAKCSASSNPTVWCG
jgi:alpha-galactosidase